MQALTITGKTYNNLLLHVAHKTGLPESKVTENALTAYLDELLEDLDDIEAADRAYAEYIASGKKSISAEQMRKKLEL